MAACAVSCAALLGCGSSSPSGLGDQAADVTVDPIDIGPEPSWPDSTEVTVGANGDALVMWPVQEDIYVARRRSGAWSPGAILAQGSSAHGVLAADGSGVVVFAAPTPPGTLAVARYVGGAFEPPVTLVTNANTVFDMALMAPDEALLVMAAGATIRSYRYHLSSGVVDPPVDVVLPAGGWSYEPKLAAMGAGMLVAWPEDDAAALTIRAARFDAASNGWSGVELVATFDKTLDEFGRLRVSASSAGDAVVIFERTSRRDITASTRDATKGIWLAAPLNPANSGSDLPAGADAGMAETGSGWVSWAVASTGEWQLNARRCSGGAWSSPQVVATDFGYFGGALAVRHSGDALLLSVPAGSIHASVARAGAAFAGNAHLVDTSTLMHDGLYSAIGPNGDTAAAWVDGQRHELVASMIDW